MTNVSEGLRQPCKRERLPFVPFEGSIQEDSQSRSSKKEEKQPTRKEPHHLSQQKGPSGSGTKAKSLVKILMPLSNVKEEVYKALDEWVAFENEFPVLAVRKTLQRLTQKEQWQRIIQVSKWMLSKGQGQTLGTYDLMLKAYDRDARLEDAETLWDKLLNLHTRSMPKNMFIRMMSIYKRREMPEKLLEVYNQMKKVGIKPDAGTLQRVGDVFIKLGMPEKQEELSKEHPSSSKLKRKKLRVQTRQPMNSKLSETGPKKALQANICVNLEKSAATKVSQVPEGDQMSRSNDNCKFGEKSKQERLNIRAVDEESDAGFLSKTSHKDDLKSVDTCGRVNLEIGAGDHDNFVNQIIATM